MHENKELFEEVFFNTADFCKLPIAIIEKDYFVTLVLKEIVKRNSDIVFKGGTSLSKCYKIIDRFSEDIDLNVTTAFGDVITTVEVFSSKITAQPKSSEINLIGTIVLESFRIPYVSITIISPFKYAIG